VNEFGQGVFAMYGEGGKEFREKGKKTRKERRRKKDTGGRNEGRAEGRKQWWECGPVMMMTGTMAIHLDYHTTPPPTPSPPPPSSHHRTEFLFQ
jgi:hypothetical protein